MERTWSWVATGDERKERITHARRIVGLRLAAVRYINIDYFRQERAPELLPKGGPRPIVDDAEWLDPTWRYMDCDSTDWGLELLTTDGRVFSVTWDPPGRREGLGIREQPLLGSAIRPDAASAVWDVSERSGWARYGSVASAAAVAL